MTACREISPPLLAAEVVFNYLLVAVPVGLGGVPGAQWSRICLPRQETCVQFVGQKDTLEWEMATHSSILAWKILWTEELGGL